MAAHWPVPVHTSGPDSATDTLAGEGASLGTVLREHVPTGRLVVLGNGGSGKTVLLERLVQGKLAEREAGGAVRIRFPLGSWPRMGPGLEAWMASYLVGLEPTLGETAPPGFRKEANRAEALLREGLVIPVLDGFDELPAGARTNVLRMINGILRAGRPLILASRPAEYRTAVNGADGVRLKLNGAAGITLQPVAPRQAEQYLRQKDGDWDQLCAHLGTDTPVGRALSTPLTLFLCRTVYARRMGDGATPAPADLCEHQRFPSEDTIRAHLFTAFIPAVYRSTDTGDRPQWSAATADRTLRFLARHRRNTEDVVGAGTDLSWWRLLRPTSRARNRVKWCLALALGTPWLLVSTTSPKALIATTIMFTLISLLTRSILSELSLSRTPAAGLRWRWRWVAAAVGALAGAGITESQVQAGSLEFAPMPYVVCSVLFALVGGAAFSWSPRTADLDRPVTPRTLLRQDLRTFLTYATSWSLALTLVVALLLGFLIGFGEPLPAAVAVGDMLAAALLFLAPIAAIGGSIGVAAALFRTACGPFALACLWYGLLGRTPFRLLAFLEDAHRRGVLRQVGGSYEFRHVELQQHLADTS
ncbi:NACHT domain-containing NTPase [Streptomyces sp. GESEQ-35]|uniref:NACHT domain-containing protein n=1 Tax=Streptomyces sp. GESEQ-35 TaxID=2812657 RepID=UPI001FF4AA46|nr:NACHT domain-containing protein [Streptomyces sp. GESEQ-35]